MGTWHWWLVLSPRQISYLFQRYFFKKNLLWRMNFQWPPESNWPEMLCAKLGGERKTGQVNHPIARMLVLTFCSLSQRLNIIIVSEGAIDRDGNPITADAVKKVFVVVDKG